MKKFLLVLLLFAATTSRGYAESTVWREAGQSCVFIGSVLGVTSIVVLYPAIAMGVNSIPVTSLILGNTLFGCGIAAIGASAAHGFGWAYDRAFGPDPSEALNVPANPPVAPHHIAPTPTPPAVAPVQSNPAVPSPVQ